MHNTTPSTMRRFFTMLFGIPILLGTSCKATKQPNTASHIHIQKENRNPKKWKVVWEDHFDAPQLDNSKWTKIPQGKSDWNDQMTDKHPDCFGWKDGKLHLIGIKNTDTLSDPRPYLTGGIYSKGKFAFQYGKIEIRAKLEAAKGAWPAIWMLPANGAKWPNGGEMDVMEHLNFDTIIYQTIHSHYTIKLKQKENPPHHGTTVLDLDAFNIFGLEWHPDKLVFTLNGKPTFTYPKIEGVDASQWPFDHPFYILIDQQLGGSWVGDVDMEQLPVNMVIDWVKVYQ